MVISFSFPQAKINMFDLESIGDHPDFSRAWFASAGSALTSTMLILAVSIHVLPLVKCLRFRIKRKKALVRSTKTPLIYVYFLCFSNKK